MWLGSCNSVRQRRILIRIPVSVKYGGKARGFCLVNEISSVARYPVVSPGAAFDSGLCPLRILWGRPGADKWNHFNEVPAPGVARVPDAAATNMPTFSQASQQRGSFAS